MLLALPFRLDCRKANSSFFPCEKVFQTTLALSLPRVGFSLLKRGAVRGRRVLILLTNAGCPTHANVDPLSFCSNLQDGPPPPPPQSFPEAKSCCDRFGYINQNHFFQNEDIQDILRQRANTVSTSNDNQNSSSGAI